MGTICAATVIIANHFKKAAHIGVTVNIAKQVEQKEACGVCTWLPIIPAFLSSHGADKREIDQRYDQPDHPALDVAVGMNMHKAFFESVC